MAFIESQFPTAISFGSSAGPMFNTDVIVVDGGHEYRNARWPTGRHMYNAAYGVKTQAQLDDLIEFYQAMQGRTHGFRWKDWLDYKSCQSTETVAFDDVTIGTGDGVETDFQLFKTYTEGARSTTRNIYKPVTGTVKSGVNGVEKTITTDFTVDTTTGIITYNVAPPNTHAVTAGFEFDVPVRFNTDQLQIVMSNTGCNDSIIGGTDIPVIELFIS